MDEEIERLMVSVRADTRGFARDVAEMRGQLEGPLEAGADRAGRAIESALLRAVRTGKLGFEDLQRVALRRARRDRGGGAARRDWSRAGRRRRRRMAGGCWPLIAGLLAASPGRATGGPVSAGAGLSGRRARAGIVRADQQRDGWRRRRRAAAREVRVAITINARGGRGAAGAGAIEPAGGAGGEGGAGGGGIESLSPAGDGEAELRT